jgi:hypothetical protein
MFQTADRALKLLALLVIVLIGLAGVYAARGMHSDGSHWLVEMLPRSGFHIFDPHRAYVQVLVQAPVAFTIWLGTLDLNTLIRVHSFGFVGVPLIFWLGALALQFQSRLFWFFLMAFTVTYLRSNFFAAGEFSVAYSMTAFCASVLLRQNINSLHALLMVLAAIALTHSYEATLFLGLFLAGLSLIRLVKAPGDRRSIRILIFISIVIFLISVYVGARSTFFQRSYDGKGTANLGALTEIHMMYLMVVPALIALLYSEYFRRFQPWLFGMLIALAGLYLIYVFRWDDRNISFGYFSYAYRALCCFLLLGVLTLATAMRFWPNELKVESASPDVRSYVAIASTIFFASMAWMMLFNTYGYYKWAQRFELEAIALKENTPIEKTAINTNHGFSYGYNWMWGNPSTSILLRGNAEAMVLNNSNLTGPVPGQYESVKAGEDLQPTDRPRLDLYPLRPFEKRGLLFPN